MYVRLFILIVGFLFLTNCKSDTNHEQESIDYTATQEAQPERSHDSVVLDPIVSIENIDLKEEEIVEKSKNFSNNQKMKTPAVSKIVFSDTSFDYGRIVQGEKVIHEYTFINQGKRPINVKDAKASCGCTRPLFPFVPIEAGKEGKILVEFNSSGRLGKQESTITVFSDGDPAIVELSLNGEVITEEFAQDSTSTIR